MKTMGMALVIVCCAVWALSQTNIVAPPETSIRFAPKPTTYVRVITAGGDKVLSGAAADGIIAGASAIRDQAIGLFEICSIPAALQVCLKHYSEIRIDGARVWPPPAIVVLPGTTK